MNRPRERCKAEADTLLPQVDRSRCEGKAACVQVCPFGVLAIGTLPVAERTGLGLRGRLKGMAHRWQQARVVDPQACHACGLCVTVCPESAITLVPR